MYSNKTDPNNTNEHNRSVNTPKQVKLKLFNTIYLKVKDKITFLKIKHKFINIVNVLPKITVIKYHIFIYHQNLMSLIN